VLLRDALPNTAVRGVLRRRIHAALRWIEVPDHLRHHAAGPKHAAALMDALTTADA
jgi:hypothetical protein